MNELVQPAGGFGGAAPTALGFGPIGAERPRHGPPSRRLSAIALVLGLLAIPTTAIGVGLALAVAAMITAQRAKAQIKKEPARYGGLCLAVAGFWSGFAALVLLVFYALAYVAAVFTMGIQ